MCEKQYSPKIQCCDIWIHFEEGLFQNLQKGEIFFFIQGWSKSEEKKNMVVFDKTTGMQFSFYLITTMITRDEETISDPVLKKLRFKLTMKKKLIINH